MASEIVLEKTNGDKINVTGDNVVISDIDNIPGSSAINKIVSISKASYDALIDKDASTLYVIVG